MAFDPSNKENMGNKENKYKTVSLEELTDKFVGKIGSPDRDDFDLALKTDLENKNTKTWSEIKKKVYGEHGAERRDELEREVETLKIGLMLRQARESLKMTQEELANKVGTTKNYISRIEYDASDIRLSTLMRIIREGLGGHLKISVEI
jgi:HTH-type transcriptional regulator / antitoxin HipB